MKTDPIVVPRRSVVPAPKPEWGDKSDCLKLFGLRESFLFELDQAGKIKSVLVKGRGKTRGKRLYNLASIRKLLRSLEEEKETA
jgi:hypothetical protein